MSKKIFVISLFIALIVTFNLNALSQESKKNFNPKPASASLYNLGLKSYENGDLDSAVSYFRKAVDLDPDFLDAYFNLGAIYKKKKDFQSAVSAFEKAHILDASDQEVMYELGSCYYQQQNYERARDLLSQIKDTFPKYNEVKQTIEKINSLNIAQKPQKNINSKNTDISNEQANLLINKLGQENNQNQIVQDNLANPEDVLKDRFKVVANTFSGPTGIVKDSQGNIFIANYLKNNIEIVYSNGTKETYYDGLVLKGPVGLTIDDTDNLYVANYGNGSVIKITPEKKISAIITDLEKPYYLFYDKNRKTLFITAQGNNSLIEVRLNNLSGNPISFR